jgi:hypothetical protein
MAVNVKKNCLIPTRFITKKMAEDGLVAPNIGVKNDPTMILVYVFAFICYAFSAGIVGKPIDSSVAYLVAFTFPFLMTFLTILIIDASIAVDNLRAIRMELYRLRQEVREAQRRCVHHHQ